MRFLHEPREDIDSRFEAFGRVFRYPVFAAPIGMLPVNFGPHYDDLVYASTLLEGCDAAGICAFTGDGPADGIFEGPLSLIKQRGGRGIPTIKNWPYEKMRARFAQAFEARAIAIATDIDCVGLIKENSPFVSRSAREMRALIEAVAPTPVILKGVMTVADAEQALFAGAAGIVVSSHGGRVLADAPAPVEVLAEIASAVKGKMTIFVDGAIRTGADVFKVLALGADAVLIGRPFVIAAYGGGASAVEQYAHTLGEDLRHTMMLAGVSSLKAIGRGHLFF